MLSDWAISVENLSKHYRLGMIGCGSLREDVDGWWNRLRGRPQGPSQLDEASGQSTGDMWALKNVSIDVRRGEVLGIIGRNGAGKSTLLKILSSITAPTSGVVKISGRIGSLLEVGTGFHPELTGRQNIFLNGAILGMSRAEVVAKMEQIIAFAEMNRFIDTPVKRYSSGMRVRLAFAVAAHLDPDILIIDEVLAVGDVAFREKCMGRMNEVAGGGRTILYVSHDMPTVENLCDRVVVLHQGKVLYDGHTQGGLKKYYELVTDVTAIGLDSRQDRTGSGRVRISGFAILDDCGHRIQTIMTGQDCIFRFHYESDVDFASEIDFAFTVRDSKHRAIFRNRTVEAGLSIPSPLPRRGVIECRIPRFPLTSGAYALGYRLVVDKEVTDYITGGYAAMFDVCEGDYFGTGKITSFAPIVLPHKWEILGLEPDKK